MGKKAVMVGCNYPGTKAELHGCINDVRRMHTSLIERFGFEEEDITILIDTDKRYTEPTGVNIKRAVDKMISESEPGDVLFFHYSGHGTRLPAETGEVDDTGYDECIVPCDMNLINDEDVREFVNKVPEGVTLTIVADSCHSGGLIDHEKEQIGESFQQKGGGEGETQGETRGLSFAGEGEGGGGWGDMLKKGAKAAWANETVREAVQKKFGDLGFGQAEGEKKHQSGNVDEYGGEEEGGDGGGGSKNRALSMETLLEILRERTGRQDVEVGNIRPTLYDMFGDDSSVKVKKFVKVMVGRLQGGGGGGGGDGEEGGGFGSMLGSYAAQFLKQKLNESGGDYAQSALQADTGGAESAYAGKPGDRRMADMGILVSGCQSNQTSADANPSGNSSQAYGALSNAVQSVLAENPGPITNRQLVMEARRLLASQGYAQRPGLYSTDHHADAVFIC